MMKEMNGHTKWEVKKMEYVSENNKRVYANALSPGAWRYFWLDEQTCENPCLRRRTLNRNLGNGTLLWKHNLTWHKADYNRIIVTVDTVSLRDFERCLTSPPLPTAPGKMVQCFSPGLGSDNSQPLNRSGESPVYHRSGATRLISISGWTEH